MPIKEASKEDIEAMKRRLNDAKAELQMDYAARMVSQLRCKKIDYNKNGYIADIIEI